MRKLFYIVLVGMLLMLVACGTTGKQARTKLVKAEPEPVPLSFEERRRFALLGYQPRFGSGFVRDFPILYVFGTGSEGGRGFEASGPFG